MNRRFAFRSVLAATTALILGAAPADASDGGNVTALAIDPLTTTTVYAGTADRGVFRSQDGGATWSPTGLKNIAITVLAIDSQNPRIVYAGTVNAGIYKSSDAGANWTASNVGLPSLEIAGLVIDSQTPTSVHALLPGAGVFRSTDGGAVWNPSLTPDSISPWASVTHLVINPQIPTRLYAYVAHNTPLQSWNELWISWDGGASWCGVWAGSEFYYTVDMRVLAVDPNSPDRLYGVGLDAGWTQNGLFKSTDGGWTWIWLSDVGIQSLVIDPSNSDVWYARTSAGLLKSVDGGSTWNAANNGLVSADIRDLSIDPVIPTILYAATDGGVFKSTDGGANWSATGTIPHSLLSSVSISPWSVLGGAESTGTVNLSAPAPMGGVLIALSSSDTSVAAVPDTLIVAGGTTSATFTIFTHSVASTTGVTITASDGGATSSTTLWVLSPTSLVYISLPNPMTGGTSDRGVVHLGGAPPAGDVTVMLTSSNPAIAIVPASVTVSSGTSYAYFPISTTSVAAPVSVTISGTFGATKSTVFTVTPPRLMSLTLNPTRVSGGTPSAGTVTLNAAAPANGLTVSLSSANTYVARVPAGVTVPQGATTAAFAVSTSAVGETIGLEISASYGGLTPSARLTVTPPPVSLSSFSLSSNSVLAGSVVIGTVTLTTAAPVEGAVIALSSSDVALATVPVSVTVPSGVTTTTFTIPTNSIAVPTPATISGSFGGVTKSAVLTVNPISPSQETSPPLPPPGDAAPGAIWRLFWRHNTEQWLAVWNMNGLRPTDSASLSIKQMTNTSWKIAGIGDLNGDGERDIVWQSNDGWLAAWYLQGTEVIFTGYLSISRMTDATWKIRGAGDTDGDRRADLIWQNSDGRLAVWFMNGTEVRETSMLSIPRMTTPNWEIRAVGDTDGNGTADILWHKSDTGELAVWYLNGANVSETPRIGTMTNANWQLVGADDVNGDDRADILWQHVDGTVAAWYLDGNRVLAASKVNSSAPNSAWRVVGPK